MDTLFLFLSLYPRSTIMGKIMNKYEKKGNKSKVEISEGKARIGTYPFFIGDPHKPIPLCSPLARVILLA